MNQGMDDYRSAPAIDAEFKGQYKALRIVSFMRWITLVIGPGAIIIDDFIQPWMVNQGLPSILTMDDLSRWFILDILGLSNYIDIDLFLEIYHHVNIISCVLFVVFIIWVEVAKRKAVSAASELTLLEDRMRRGV